MSNPTIRQSWVSLLNRVATPPLQALAEGRLRASMPVEAQPEHAAGRRAVTHLEALGRTLAGIAPWLELTPAGDADIADDAEAKAHTQLDGFARAALEQALTPGSPDHLDFNAGPQSLVDAAFLAHALLRAPRALWQASDATTQARLVDALRLTRRIAPPFNNWLLFSAMIEAALFRFTGEADLMRIEYAIRQHEQWYKGDSAYGDGPAFHWDYYNSFVIQPMLLDVAEATVSAPFWQVNPCETLLPAIRERAVRYAGVLERLIAADGTFPPIGRSLAYRCGAFQHLAQMALRRELPASVSPPQVRDALTAVIRRTLEAPGTFDEAGWLRIGLCGHQPGLGEMYISTGSLYLCTTAFLPLGLPADDPFWTLPEAPWTSVKIWRGDNHGSDYAIK